MQRPNTFLYTHLAAHLPAFLDEHPALAGTLGALRPVVERAMLMDVDHIAPDLRACGSQRRSGRRPREERMMFLSLWFCGELGEGQLNQWVRRLKSESLLRLLIGCQPGERPPSVGAHYRFCSRLLDGDRAGKPKAAWPSTRLRGSHGRFARVLDDERGVARQEVVDKDGICRQVCEELTGDNPPPPRDDLRARLVRWMIRMGVCPLVEAGVLPAETLWDGLIDGTVCRSHAKGYGHSPAEPEPGVGPATRSAAPTDSRVAPGAGSAATSGNAVAPLASSASSDGSTPSASRAATTTNLGPPTPSAASTPTDAPVGSTDGKERRGKKKPRAAQDGRMSRKEYRRRKKDTPRRLARQERIYSDPDADWRWSNAGDGGYVFGHLGLVISVRAGTTDIPIMTGFAANHRGETPEMMRLLHSTFDTLAGELAAAGLPDVRWRSLTGDAGYDSDGFYLFAHRHGIAPIVAESGNANAVADDGTERAANGVPLCPGGAIMQRHGIQHGAIVYRCPAIRNVRRNGETCYEFQPQLCPNGKPCDDSKLGPSVRLRPEDHPRLNLPIPRATPLFEELYNQRTAVERYNAHLHRALPHRTWRRKHLWEIGTFLHALGRQMDALRAASREWLDDAWATITAPLPRAAVA